VTRGERETGTYGCVATLEFGTNAGQEPLEELVQTQALSLDLREAVMACLSGRESRRWTVGELVERFKGLGVYYSIIIAVPGRPAVSLSA
jgi:hypothetical protein